MKPCVNLRFEEHDALASLMKWNLVAARPSVNGLFCRMAGQVFAQFFANYFGITIGSSAVDSNMSMDPACMTNIANVMYSFDCIPFNVYCELMPMGSPPSEMVVSKMMQYLGTNGYQFQNMEQCVAYCTQYIMDEKRQISARNQDPSQLFNPVFRVTQ